MEYTKNCPNCNSVMKYGIKGNLDRSLKNNSMCRECSGKKKWENPINRKKASESRKKYLSGIPYEKKEEINFKISEKNKIVYQERSEEWKENWKSICSSISSERWKNPEYKKRVSKSMSDNNWSIREDAKEIKKRQVNSRIENNNGLYSKGPGLCKEYVINDIFCYGSFEKKYIEILCSNQEKLPTNVKSSIVTKYGTYTPDFEFPDFFVEVKSKFTYDVLMGIKSYSKNRKSSPDQLNKIKWISENVKKVKIAIVDKETIEYIDV